MLIQTIDTQKKLISDLFIIIDGKIFYHLITPLYLLLLFLTGKMVNMQ